MSNPQHVDYDGICMPLALMDNPDEMNKHLAERYPDDFLGETIFDFSEMRTHRLPEDDEGMDETNQILSRMPKSLMDSLNGITEENPEGTHKLVSVRLPIELLDKLTKRGQSLPVKLGHQALIQAILKEYANTHNL